MNEWSYDSDVYMFLSKGESKYISNKRCGSTDSEISADIGVTAYGRWSENNKLILIYLCWYTKYKLRFRFKGEYNFLWFRGRAF